MLRDATGPLAGFREPLVRFFTRHTRSREIAEDLAQEVLVRAIGRGGVPELERPHAFIFVIASNLLRDRARRAKGRRDLSIESVAPDRLAEEIDPERVLSSRQTLQRVVDALSEMNERTRDIFLLYRLDGLKQREIAQRFGVSVSAVEKHIAKAVAHLASRGCRP